jgi:ribosomal protein S18 acetylase RimI-like enzyme
MAVNHMASQHQFITIRLATLEDYPGFLSVARETNEHHAALLPGIFRSAEVAVPEEYFAGLVTGEQSCIFLAECDGVVVGYATLQLHHARYAIQVPRTVAFIDNFGIAEAHRRLGVGRRLFAACLEWARAMGSSSLDLDCWEANQDAIRFYENMGMQVSHRRFTLDL